VRWAMFALILTSCGEPPIYTQRCIDQAYQDYNVCTDLLEQLPAVENINICVDNYDQRVLECKEEN